MSEWCIPVLVTLTLTLTSDFISRFFVSGAYLLNSFWGIRHVTVIFLVILANSTDPVEMPLYYFTVCQSTCLWVFRMKRVNLYKL